ncbi:MAG: hypothetical protein COB24_09155 [Hyphomicrobiales bacterium]|nr:MAG: hypothetical protein COB24_09155 [Hyphomicrobiales bacterium]
MATNIDTKYLCDRYGVWWFQRRVKKKIINILGCPQVEFFSLKTDDLKTAQLKRDLVVKNQNEYWAKLIANGADEGVIAYYDRIIDRAKSLEIEYKHIDDLNTDNRIDVLIDRINLLDKNKNYESEISYKAILGRADKPNPKISEVLDIYLDKLILPKLGKKSHRQQQHVINPKKRVVKYFIDLVTDKPIYDITRNDAQRFFEWLQLRINSPLKDKITANTGNRYLTEIRGILKDYYTYQGDDDILDPFRKMKFKEKNKSKRDSFSTEYITDLLKSPDKLATLDIAARVVIYAMINTGLRPSEICNILPETIFLDAPVPYLAIIEQEDRELKSDAAVREIPLIGVSLHAFRFIKKGAIKKFKDRSDTFSASANKFFVTNKLFPKHEGEVKKKYTIYSFRHSFKKRMIEAGVDVEIRDVSMGHKINKPDYSDYGSIEFRMKLIKKIDLPYDKKIFD